MAQTEWAKGFTSPSLHESGGVAFLREQVNAHPGEITIIAVGELTNVAALLASEPGIGAKIKAISLMGGAVRRGYAPGSKPEPEWNIKSNAKAAQVVFTSGVPLLVDYVRAGNTVVLTTHILEVAERLADRIGIIARGALIAEGTLEELRKELLQPA